MRLIIVVVCLLFLIALYPDISAHFRRASSPPIPIKEVVPIGYENSPELHTHLLLDMAFDRKIDLENYDLSKLNPSDNLASKTNTLPSKESISTLAKKRGLVYTNWIEADYRVADSFHAMKRNASTYKPHWKDCELFSVHFNGKDEGLIFEIKDPEIQYVAHIRNTQGEMVVYNPTKGIVLYDCETFKTAWTNGMLRAQKIR